MFLKIHIILFALFQISQSANLFSNAKQNPKCKKIFPTKKLDMEWALQLFVGKKFYLPMGSKSGFEDLTELLSGTMAKNSEEINKMCPEIRVRGFKSTIEGYDGRYMIVDCAVVKKGLQDCEANPRTEFPDRHKAVKGMQTLAWTDNKESILIVRCSPDGEKNDWMLYSLNTTIDDELKKKVKEQIKKMGFPQSAEYPVHYSNYTGCKMGGSED